MRKNANVSVGPSQVFLFTIFPLTTLKVLKLDLSYEPLSSKHFATLQSRKWKRREAPPGTPSHGHLRLGQKWTVRSFSPNAVLGGVQGEVGLVSPL